MPDMNMGRIVDTWGALAGKRDHLVGTFYDRLFERYPDYASLFSDEMGGQREKMVEMFTRLAVLADHIDIIHPYVAGVGVRHARLGLRSADFHNFKDVFVDALAEVLEERWTEADADAWLAAFEDVIIPIIEDACRTGPSAHA